MNFLLKMMMFVLASSYTYAVCTTPETNASNNLRLAHSVCPKLFEVDETIKEKTIISYYRNDHRGIGANLIGNPISIMLNGMTITQAWEPAGLTATVGFLRDKINATGNYTATSAGGKLTVIANSSGYQIDAMGNGGTNIDRTYGLSADVNWSGFGTAYGLGYNATEENKTYILTDTTNKVDVTKAITKMELSINGQAGVVGNTAATGVAALVTELNKLTTSATITAVGAIGITITNKTGGPVTDTWLRLSYTTTDGTPVVRPNYLMSGTVTQGLVPKASKRRVYYYGNEGNYSINFFKGLKWDGNNSNKGDNTTYETSYLGTMSNTLNKLAQLVDANGTYDAFATGINEAEGYGYLDITDRTPRAYEHNISGRSGDGNASVKVEIQGLAVPEDLNMTYITYNDNFLYTTFKVQYDVETLEFNNSGAVQDILEIFKVSHADNPENTVINTLDLTSVEVLRDDNITSVVALNDIVFVGDENSSYYKFNRANPSTTTANLTDEQKLEEPNKLENVKANMTEYYQDGDDGYAFIADGTRLRVYQVAKDNKVKYYTTFYNFGGEISDLVRDDEYLYVQSNEGDRLTKFTILTENDRFSIERTKTFTLDADKIYIRGKYLYYTNGDATPADIYKGYRGEINGSIISNPEVINSNAVSFMVGDELYSASIGNDGLKIYDVNKTLNSADGAFRGSQILILGEFIITNDLNSSQIRIYKFGDVSVSSREGEGSPSKPFNLSMMANKINMDDVNWSLQKNGSTNKIQLNQKKPIYPFTEPGLWFVQAVVTYKNYNIPSVYKYRVNVLSDNAPSVEINASVTTGLTGLKVDFTSIIATNSYVDYTKWDFNDSNEDGSNAESFMRNPSWTFNKKGDHNVTFIAYYDGDKNVTTAITIHISEPLEMNTTNIDGNNTTIHIKGEDINFSIGLYGNDDFSYWDPTGGGGGGAWVIKPIKSYTWSFGDAANSVSYLEKPVFKYNTVGDYTITAEIITKEDKVKKISETKYIIKKTISVVDFEKPTIIADKVSGETPLTVNFSVSLKGYLVKNVRPESIQWEFTGGDTSAKQNPTYTFTNPAVNGYLVHAKVKLDDGKILDLTKTIYVKDIVELKITATAQAGHTPLTVNFNAEGSSFEGINRYEWEIGLKGGEKTKKTGTAIEHTFNTNGTYEVNATAWSNKDHNGTANLTIVVEKGPDVTIDGNVSVNDETEIKFTAIKNDAAAKAINDINTSWYINDIEMAVGTPTFTYKFLDSKAYKIEYRVSLTGGKVVKYVYKGNALFNPYIKKVPVYLGWNLISSPLDENFEVTPTEGIPKQATDKIERLRAISSVIWTFSANAWHQNPATIARKLGFWIQATKNTELVFDGDTPYTPSLDGLTAGQWYLVGTGKRLDKYQATNAAALEVIWVYRAGKWYKNTPIINPGDGLWIKAK